MKFKISKQGLMISFVYLVFVSLISVIWYLYEFITMGHLNPNGFDSLIALGFAFSLTLNWYLLKK